MKVIVFVKASPESEAGVMPTQELLTAMGNFNEELVKAGIMLAGEGLHPSSKGARVRFSGSNRTVIDGPFAETKELVAGFWIWQVKSLDEAIAWVKRCPNPMLSDSEIEIRPIFSAEDFGEILTPELRDQEARILAASQHLAGSAESTTPEKSSSSTGRLDPPRFEQGSEMRIAGLSATYDRETRKNIPQQWDRFETYKRSIPGQVGRSTFGVCSNFLDGCRFDYLCGVEVEPNSELPDGLTRIRIPKQRYAVFTHRGNVSGIAATFDYIWNQWFPSSGCLSVETPCVECYSEDFDAASGRGSIEIWIPIKT
ncbi:MAG: GyrI-like domain-containing protein [Planctomycetia bacterium]|nr:GyrI-like domain-containing protein [Planctomycetia bacterium]